jgi:hypothetical protein
MKKSLLPVFLVFYSPSFAQTGQNVQEDLSDITVVMSPKNYGYINGVRLDSIDAVYGEFSRYRGESLYFD